MSGRSGYEVIGSRVGQARQTLKPDGRRRMNDDDQVMTQEDLAALVGIHRVTLTKIETGNAKVSLEVLERLCTALGRTREWLLGQPEQVDAYELARERMANAMDKIGSGFEDFADAVALLEGRAREAGQAPVEVEA